MKHRLVRSACILLCVLLLFVVVYHFSGPVFERIKHKLKLFPPLAIEHGTVTDGGIMYIRSDIPDRITFKFNHSIHGDKQITIQPVGGAPLGWDKHFTRDSVSITPPNEDKRLMLGTYTIKLRRFEDIARNRLNTDITFDTGVFPLAFYLPKDTWWDRLTEGLKELLP